MWPYHIKIFRGFRFQIGEPFATAACKYLYRARSKGNACTADRGGGTASVLAVTSSESANRSFIASSNTNFNPTGRLE